jgi:hypothetical protein
VLLAAEDEWNDYIDCLDSNLVCEDNEADIKGRDCQEEEDALEDACNVDAG